MTEDTIARRLFREQIRKELLDEIQSYKVGFIINGEILFTRSTKFGDGILLIIPKDKYLELFEEDK